MAKTSVYDPLRAFLSAQLDTVDKLSLAFGSVEDILRRPLPPTAHRDPAWWANELSDDSRHTQARLGWLAAGWKASPDLEAKTVTFSRRR